MRLYLSTLCLLAAALPLHAADAPPAPPASIALGARHASATPTRQGFAHTGGGNIDVSQPSSDTVVITMTGVAVAGAHPCKDSATSMTLNLEQDFDISLDKPEARKLKLSIEGRVIGLLRSPAKGKGVAEESAACATVACGLAEVVTLCAPGHSVCAGESLSINDRAGPSAVSVMPGKYVLHQSFQVAVNHPHSVFPSKAASAEFAPDPALDPLWISAWEPFHGASKKDFGFQIIMKVSAE